ncbi:MAG: metallophosphoesterase [Candidatus Altiarchaeota archaeon]
MIGILSDTHDNLDAIKKAVNFFNRQNVSVVLHAGDYVAPFTAKEFKNLNSKLIGVFGNNDGDRVHLAEVYKKIGCELKDFHELEQDGKFIALYHGTDDEISKALIKYNKYDIIILGHSHKAEIKAEKKKLIINPGETCGYLTGNKTVALLDTKNLKAKIFHL